LVLAAPPGVSMQLDSKAIAARLRSVLPSLRRGKFEACAARLGVSEIALRMSIDADEPHPTLEVVAAVVQHYGVDPCWLMAGEYDPAAHRAAIADDSDSSKSELLRLIAMQLIEQGTPPGQQPAISIEA
jgi:hypothetical protein